MAILLSVSGSNYPYLEQVSMVPKMFEQLFQAREIHLFQ